MMNAAESSNAAVQTLLAAKQTAAANGDSSAVTAIEAQIAALGYS